MCEHSCEDEQQRQDGPGLAQPLTDPPEEFLAGIIATEDLGHLRI